MGVQSEKLQIRYCGLETQVESAGLIASSHAALQLDAARVDWALRSLPQWVGQLESVTRSLERLSEEAREATSDDKAWRFLQFYVWWFESGCRLVS